MSARSWSKLLVIACMGLGLPACGGAFANSPAGASARVPLAPAGVLVDDDVADGYVAYSKTLAAYGQWEADATYGVHWCPSSSFAAPFHPYVSNGHWATSERAQYGSPPGSIYWADDETKPWTAATTHHGWWIDLGADDWCWVPGAKETPARVVWRTSDDFVGWAPEPPTWVDDGDEDDSAAAFEWCFEFLGTLLEDAVDAVDKYSLKGDAAKTASRATGRSHSDEPGSTFSRRPPAQPAVVAARSQLVAYVRAHESEHASAETGGSQGRSTASSTTSTSTTSSSSSSSTSHQDSDDAKVDLAVERLPPGAMLVTMVPADLGGAAFGRTEGEGAVGTRGVSGGSTSAVVAQNGSARARSTDRAAPHATRSVTYHSTRSSSSSSGTSRSSSGGSSSHHK
jgi:hypothetical protein